MDISHETYMKQLSALLVQLEGLGDLMKSQETARTYDKGLRYRGARKCANGGYADLFLLFLEPRGILNKLSIHAKRNTSNHFRITLRNTSHHFRITFLITR